MTALPKKILLSVVLSLIAQGFAGSLMAVVTVPFTDSSIKYLGRWDASSFPNYTHSYWSGASFKVGVQGTNTLTVNLDPTQPSVASWYRVDGATAVFVSITAGVNVFPLGTTGQHTFQLIMNFNDSPIYFGSLTLPDGASVDTPNVLCKTMDIYGDSISAGYVVATGSGNITMDYTYKAANLMGVELQDTAKACIALTNPGPCTLPPMDTAYQYIEDPLDSPYLPYNFSTDNPSVVVLALGDNDYWGGESNADFQSIYQTMLTNLRSLYPSASIFALIEMHSYNGVPATFYNPQIYAAVAACNDSNMFVVDTTGWLTLASEFQSDAAHPNDTGHTIMAQNLVATIVADAPNSFACQSATPTPDESPTVSPTLSPTFSVSPTISLTPTSTATPGCVPVNQDTFGGSSVSPFWGAQDIGPSELAGSQIENGSLTVTAGGGDVNANPDTFRYLYQAVTGNIDVSIQVNGVPTTDGWSKGGLMLRETLSPGAVNAFMAATGSNQYEFQSRSITAGAAVGSGSVGSYTNPSVGYVRITRVGNIFSGYYSANGSSWTLVTTYTLPMANNYYVGIAVSSDTASLGTASFNNFKILSGGTCPGTPTPTPTPTPTTSSSSTSSATRTYSPTATLSASPSSTLTFTPTQSLSATLTPSSTSSRSATPTPTISVTVTLSESATISATRTNSFTASPSVTISLTPSGSPTATPSSSVSATLTPSASLTNSATQTDSFTASPSATPSLTSSPSQTATSSATASPSATCSLSVTSSLTPTETFTTSPSVTLALSTPSATATQTFQALVTPESVPVISSLSVSQGPVLGGTLIIVTGSSFAIGIKASLGGATANVEYLSPTTLQITSPGHDAGFANLVLTNEPSGLTGTKLGAFNYVASPLEGPLVIDRALPDLNPSPHGPASFKVLFEGGVDSLTLKIYTEALTCVGSYTVTGNLASQWQTITVSPTAFSSLGSGTYYFEVTGSRAAATSSHFIGKFMILR